MTNKIWWYSDALIIYKFLLLWSNLKALIFFICLFYAFIPSLIFSEHINLILFLLNRHSRKLLGLILRVNYNFQLLTVWNLYYSSFFRFFNIHLRSLQFLYCLTHWKLLTFSNKPMEVWQNAQYQKKVLAVKLGKFFWIFFYFFKASIHILAISVIKLEISQMLAPNVFLRYLKI